MKTLGRVTLLVPLVLGTLSTARVKRQVEDPNYEFLWSNQEGENVDDAESPGAQAPGGGDLMRPLRQTETLSVSRPPSPAGELDKEGESTCKPPYQCVPFYLCEVSQNFQEISSQENPIYIILFMEYQGQVPSTL